MILALDLGSKLGWAKGSDGELFLSGTESLIVDGWFGVRSFHYFRTFLMKHWLPNPGIKMVVEKPHSRMPGFHAYRVLFGMLGLVQEMATYDKDLYLVSAKAVKKYWTGYGNANKEWMECECFDRLAIEPVDDNEADAIAMLHYGFDELGLTKE